MTGEGLEWLENMVRARDKLRRETSGITQEMIGIPPVDGGQAVITEAMLSKANEAYFHSRGNDVEKLRAALEAIAPELLGQGMEKAADMIASMRDFRVTPAVNAEAAMELAIEAAVSAIRASAALTRERKAP